MNKSKQISQRIIVLVLVEFVFVLFVFFMLCIVCIEKDNYPEHNSVAVCDTNTYTLSANIEEIDSIQCVNLKNEFLKLPIDDEKQVLSDKPVHINATEKINLTNDLKKNEERPETLIINKLDSITPKIVLEKGQLSDLAIKVSETDPGKLLNDALMLLSQGDTVKARKQISEIAEKNKKYIQAWSELARLSIIQHDRKFALKALKRLLMMAYTKKLQKNIEETITFVEENLFSEALQQFEKLSTEKQFK